MPSLLLLVQGRSHGRRVETLTHFALDLGFSTFLLIAPADPGTLITFIEDIGPAVRDEVDKRRASPV